MLRAARPNKASQLPPEFGLVSRPEELGDQQHKSGARGERCNVGPLNASETARVMEIAFMSVLWRLARYPRLG